jgi:hypothetical protein
VERVGVGVDVSVGVRLGVKVEEGVAVSEGVADGAGSIGTAVADACACVARGDAAEAVALATATTSLPAAELGLASGDRHPPTPQMASPATNTSQAERCPNVRHAIAHLPRIDRERRPSAPLGRTGAERIVIMIAKPGTLSKPKRGDRTIALRAMLRHQPQIAEPLPGERMVSSRGTDRVDAG